MKLLVAADLHPAHNFMMERRKGLIDGLSPHDVEFVDILDFWGDADEAHRMEELIGDARRRREFFGEADLDDLNRGFLSRLMSRDWEMLWLCTISHWGRFLLPASIRTLRSRGFVVGFMGDDELHFEFNRFWCPLFDAVVGYTEREVRSYKRWNPAAFLLPIGVPMIKAPARSSLTDQVVFVGRPYGTRPEYLRRVHEAGLPLRIYGSSAWRRYSELRPCYQGYLSAEDFWHVLSQAGIVLNLMEDHRGNPHVNAKVFEAAAVESMVITTPYAPFETTYGLTEHEDIVLYDGPEDLVSKITQYLADPNRRAKVASNLADRLRPFRYDRLYPGLMSELIDASSGESMAEATGAVDVPLSRWPHPQGEAKPDPSPHSAGNMGPMSSELSKTGGAEKELHQDLPSDAARPGLLVIENGSVTMDPSAPFIASRAVSSGLEDCDGFYFDSLFAEGTKCEKPFFADAQSIIWMRSGLDKYKGRKLGAPKPGRIYLVLAGQLEDLFEALGLPGRVWQLLSRLLRAFGPDLIHVPVPATRISDSRTGKRLRGFNKVADKLRALRDWILHVRNSI